MPGVGKLNLEFVGLAVKRYIELGLMLEQLGVDHIWLETSTLV